MARHIMAVCVVCLLCADHIPCQQHFDSETAAAATLKSSTTVMLDHDEYKNSLNARVFQRTDLPQNPSIAETNSNIGANENSVQNENFDAVKEPKNLQKLNIKNNVNYKGNEWRHAQYRRKRHAGHSHETEGRQQKRPEITESFLRRIFEKYGNSVSKEIHINEFQQLLKRLGLEKFLEHNVNSTEANNETCISDVALVNHLKSHDLNHHQEDHLQDHDANCQKNESSKFCNSPHHQQLHRTYAVNYSIAENDLYNICPVLLYQLLSPLTSDRSGCIQTSVLVAIDYNEVKLYKDEKDDILFVWIYAFISVFACGLLGLVGVAIIPFMDSQYYKHIIQFLVSLAVGTMTGDALLHLLPHSLAGQSETNMIFKGLTCMCGIIFFYMTEHGLTMISEWRKGIAKKETKNPARAKVLRDPDSSINNSVTGDKLCKSKYSSYPYCYDEIAMDTKNDVWMHVPHNTSDGGDISSGHVANNTERRHNGRDTHNCTDANETVQSLLSTSHNNYAPISEMNHNHNINHNSHQHMHDSNILSTHLDENSTTGGCSAAAININENGNKERSVANNDTVTVILREHESSHHGHSHLHGHVHSPPESLSAVAWMIIMGDGLHNFTDGMAIGAAFAENIAGGFSTSLAVFCHELPHELGDFAILIKAGMSVKSAVYYNLLTGVLSFIGMIFGIVFGQSQEAAQWMFAAAAGLFIYIALVDMMPELSASHKTLEQFVLQILGMSSGVLIMLLIAVYEDNLMNIFDSSLKASATGQNNVH